MDRTFSKQITDPLYGTIGLTPVEVDVIGTRVFQRLSRIGQLGMAHLVFPGAQYSRLEHSIGVCHIAGAIIESLEATKDGAFSDEDWQRYRLAALLHDVGHYPFSHAFENALKSAYDKHEYEKHEAVGGQILKYDEELRDVIEQLELGFTPEDISAVFLRQDKSEHTVSNPFAYADILSSGLDADRLDYLRRTAHHTGVPYGSIDGDYLVNQFCLVNDRVALTHRARLTADHFLLSRWFEYQKVIHHHAVQAADATLEDVLEALFENDGRYKYTSRDVEKKIKSGTWADFDDVKTLEAIRNLQEETRHASDEKDEVIHNKCRALLERRLPKTVYEDSLFRNSTKPDAPRPLSDDALQNLADKYAIHRDYWTLWTANSPFTKMRKDKEHDIRVQPKFENTTGPNNNGGTMRLVDDDRALISRLAEDERYTWRLYVLFPHEWDEQKVEDTRRAIRSDLIENYLEDSVS
jgi:HD superfamily phosphohydrolase